MTTGFRLHKGAIFVNLIRRTSAGQNKNPTMGFSHSSLPTFLDVMSLLISALSFSNDLQSLPVKLVSQLSKGQTNPEEFIPLIVRAVLLWFLVTSSRRLWGYSTACVSRAIFPTVHISSRDPSYEMIMVWIAKDHGARRQLHDYELNTSEARWLRSGKRQTDTKGEPWAMFEIGGIIAGEHTSSWRAGDVVGQQVPLVDESSQSIRIKHNGNYLWITRRVSHRFSEGARVEIQTIAYRPHIIQNFIAAVNQNFYEKEDKELRIFHSNDTDVEGRRINPTWMKPITRRAREWGSVILPPGMKEEILEDVKRFLSEKDRNWHASRGIPHRKGMVLYGEPGTGKTSLVTALASKLNIDMYIVNPAQRGMDDAKLSTLLRNCPSETIVLIEDIDCIFPSGRHNNVSAMLSAVDETPGGEIDGLQADDGGEAEVQLDGAASHRDAFVGGGGQPPSTVTISGLLNALDGVSSQEGCVIIATTNHLERLDPALIREGRFDNHIHFTFLIPRQAHDLYIHLFPLEDFGPHTERSNFDIVNEKPEKSVVIFTDQADLEKHASDFADAIFSTPNSINLPAEEVKLSKKITMAALQSYLTGHKYAPIEALEGAAKWVEGYEATQQERSRVRLTAARGWDYSPVKKTTPKKKKNESVAIGGN
ncbi:hypothetical protein, variant [Cryptococcus amylolentus CBS 6039]|uniref:AAA+ ATPase domain-containing protein n=1 Tax=Cryptococcus amylolentus CBS 6039 TaxID=1295533 RepID=A0A1E3I3L4_9TREE|nr:hypothetical protein, variant [Cryptococcus amylolentus CBS 6039]ODN83214.1 hypothetical protein, variant [Cryptococcus amylolentus CBS 6039]